MSTSSRMPPKPVRVLVACSWPWQVRLPVDALLVALGTAAFPATKGYGHFHFSDDGLLTVVGVVMACASLDGGRAVDVGPVAGSSSVSLWP